MPSDGGAAKPRKESKKKVRKAQDSEEGPVVWNTFSPEVADKLKEGKVDLVLKTPKGGYGDFFLCCSDKAPVNGIEAGAITLEGMSVCLSVNQAFAGQKYTMRELVGYLPKVLLNHISVMTKEMWGAQADEEPIVHVEAVKILLANITGYLSNTGGLSPEEQGKRARMVASLTYLVETACGLAPMDTFRSWDRDLFDTITKFDAKVESFASADTEPLANSLYPSLARAAILIAPLKTKLDAAMQKRENVKQILVLATDGKTEDEICQILRIDSVDTLLIGKPQELEYLTIRNKRLNDIDAKRANPGDGGSVPVKRADIPLISQVVNWFQPAVMKANSNNMEEFLSPVVKGGDAQAKHDIRLKFNSPLYLIKDEVDNMFMNKALNLKTPEANKTIQSIILQMQEIARSYLVSSPSGQDIEQLLESTFNVQTLTKYITSLKEITEGLVVPFCIRYVKESIMEIPGTEVTKEVIELPVLFGSLAAKIRLGKLDTNKALKKAGNVSPPDLDLKATLKQVEEDGVSLTNKDDTLALLNKIWGRFNQASSSFYQAVGFYMGYIDLSDNDMIQKFIKAAQKQFNREILLQPICNGMAYDLLFLCLHYVRHPDAKDLTTFMEKANHPAYTSTVDVMIGGKSIFTLVEMEPGECEDNLGVTMIVIDGDQALHASAEQRKDGVPMERPPRHPLTPPTPRPEEAPAAAGAAPAAAGEVAGAPAPPAAPAAAGEVAGAPAPPAAPAAAGAAAAAAGEVAGAPAPPAAPAATGSAPADDMMLTEPSQWDSTPGKEKQRRRSAQADTGPATGEPAKKKKKAKESPPFNAEEWIKPLVETMTEFLKDPGTVSCTLDEKTVGKLAEVFAELVAAYMSQKGDIPAPPPTNSGVFQYVAMEFGTQMYVESDSLIEQVRKTGDNLAITVVTVAAFKAHLVLDVYNKLGRIADIPDHATTFAVQEKIRDILSAWDATAAAGGIPEETDNSRRQRRSTAQRPST